MSLETCYAYTVMLALLAGAYTRTLTQLIVSVFNTCSYIHDAVTLPCKLVHKHFKPNVMETFVAIACID